MKTLRISLKAVSLEGSLSCAQLALCAATGCCSISDVNSSILKAAHLCPEIKLNWAAINTRIWRKALEILGFTAEVIAFDPRDTLPRPDVNLFMAGNTRKDVILVVSMDQNDPEKDHVFAAQEKLVVDGYTEGRVEVYRPAANPLGHSRVDHFVCVRRRPHA